MKIQSSESKKLVELCQKHNVQSIALVGSAVRKELKDTNDIDFLVSFSPDLPVLDYADNFFALQGSLEKLFKKPIDLISRKSLKNPILIQSLESSKVSIYEA